MPASRPRATTSSSSAAARPAPRSPPACCARKPDLDIAIIDPADIHYYQPGWTMVGAGVFDAASRPRRPMAAVLPRRVTGSRRPSPASSPSTTRGPRGLPRHPLQAPRRLPRHQARLGRHRRACAKRSAATASPPTIATTSRPTRGSWCGLCARGARCSRSRRCRSNAPARRRRRCTSRPTTGCRNGRLKDIEVEFYNAGGVLFGVADYVPALMEYVERYDAALNFNHTLVADRRAAAQSLVREDRADGSAQTVETSFDMIHVCPPQLAPDFVRASPLADSAGWVDVDHATLRHKRYRERLRARRRDEHAERQDRGRGAQAGAGRRRERAVRQGLRRERSAPTTAMAPARSPSSAARSCWPSSAMAASSRRRFPRWLIDGTKPSRARLAPQGAHAAARSIGRRCSRAASGWQSRRSWPDAAAGYPRHRIRHTGGIRARAHRRRRLAWPCLFSSTSSA